MKTTTKVNDMNQHPKSMQKVFNLNGIIHLPHYKHEGVFVSPSDGVGKSESYLIERGAVEQEMFLWDRYYN